MFTFEKQMSTNSTQTTMIFAIFWMIFFQRLSGQEIALNSEEKLLRTNDFMTKSVFNYNCTSAQNVGFESIYFDNTGAHSQEYNACVGFGYILWYQYSANFTGNLQVSANSTDIQYGSPS